MRSDPAVHPSDRGGRAERAAPGPRSRWRLSPTASRSWARCRARQRRTAIHPGMRLGEALARCPGLRLVPPDPERAASSMGGGARRARGDRRRGRAGAPGRGLLRRRGAAPHVRRPPRGCARARAQGRRMPARLGAAPSRFCAFAAARPRAAGARLEDRPGGRRARVPRAAAGVAAARVRSRRSLPPCSSGSACARWASSRRCRASDVADRFGALGLRARELAGGERCAAAPARRRARC